MKRIAIFCDGTWNSPTMKVPTNVVSLSKACLNKEGEQKIIYQPGVGVNDFTNKLISVAHKIGCGAFGWGLGKNVKAAYRELCLCYEPGDEIYVFGFSRGAYTARSLGGMIRKCGIAPKDKIRKRSVLDRAWKLYKTKFDQMDKGPAWDQRKALSPDVATSEADWIARGKSGTIVEIRYMGVWDTVGAKGLPMSLLGPVAKWWNRRYEFYDMKLSSMVRNARHAIALDEHRVLYQPTPWDNLTKLNSGADGDDAPYQQLWFVGDHGTVGGSKDTRQLVAFPLEWVAKGAMQLGLKMNDTALIPDVEGVADAPSPYVKEPAGALQAWRRGPSDPRAYHWSVAERMRRINYRPRSVAVLPNDFPLRPMAEDITPETRLA
ncbi:DUF2235 domain-containing protein [Loktanella agnita]|uniref:DUF2235 domain-containing protein n=1 Tax=Loktanella agnita TaxID=287097 RepID=UPI003987DC1B